MQLRWFHIRGVCIAPGCVYRSSSAKQGMGIPGDHVNRVETYHYTVACTAVARPERIPTIPVMRSRSVPTAYDCTAHNLVEQDEYNFLISRSNRSTGTKKVELSLSSLVYLT